MDIPKIGNLQAACKMRREVLNLAREKNIPEGDVWLELEIYRKTHSEGKNEAKQLKSLIRKILTKSRIHITKSPL